jgi:hypothetical protein
MGHPWQGTAGCQVHGEELVSDFCHTISPNGVLQSQSGHLDPWTPGGVSKATATALAESETAEWP